MNNVAYVNPYLIWMKRLCAFLLLVRCQNAAGRLIAATDEKMIEANWKQKTAPNLLSRKGPRRASGSNRGAKLVLKTLGHTMILQIDVYRTFN